MAIKCVAIMAPGDMGHAIGAVLSHGGVRVISNLEGRSKRTVDLAAKAGIESVAGDAELLSQADAVFSIMPPDQASGFVARIAVAAKGIDNPAMLVDLNAVSPGTAHKSAATAEAAGLDFVDGGIIGGPPKIGGYQPRLYVSGPRHAELLTFCDAGLDVRGMDGGIGAGSAIKMCYASMTKGISAIAMQSMITARIHRIADDFGAEMRSSQAMMLDWLEGMVPRMPPKAYRWVGEMEEIAATFQEVGLSEKIFQGAADTYRFIEGTPLGQEVVENRTMGQTTDDVADRLAEALQKSRQT